MELNLRKARKLEKTIENHLKEHSLNTNVNIRVQQTKEAIDKDLKTAQDHFLTVVTQRQSLIEARYKIRELIAEANTKTGISYLIHQKAYAENLLAEVKSVASTQESVDVHDLVAVKKNALEKGNLGYNAEDVLRAEVSAVPQALRNKQILEVHHLKSEIERIDDELSQKNVGVTIRLDANTENLLKQAKLL